MAKKIHLILTVGKNPLPVWVAWDRLTDYWKDHEVAVQFVYTSGSEDEKECLKAYCTAACATVRDDIETDARNPDMESIQEQIVSALGADFTDLHVHYTGGTQAMGVATFGAMLLAPNTLPADRSINLDASYLDPGRGTLPATSSRPAIVSWKHNSLIADTRVGIDADLKKIANLNGFRTGPFESHDPPRNCPLPNVPSPEQLSAGAVLLDNYRGDVETQFRNNFPKGTGNPWWTIFHPQSGNFAHPNGGGTVSLRNITDDGNIWTDAILPAVNAAYPDCKWNCAARRLSYPAKGTATSDQKNDLEDMDKLFTGHWLEYAAYAAFKRVLADIADRGNFKLYHNVYVAQQGTGTAARHFELDIVAVLGYQIIVISCSITSNKNDIKQKAMEAYHRAKQLGGDEARAVMLCVASAQDADRVEKELEDETGIQRPLQVWGRQQRRGPVPDMKSLCAKFRELCQNLSWD